MTRFRSAPVVAIVSAVLAVQIALLSCRPSPPPAEKTEPEKPAVERRVQFAGHDRCAECHADIASLHHASGHSRTFALAQDSQAAQDLCGTRRSDKPPYGPYRYVCDDEGLAAALPERFGNRLFPIDFALGSGTNAVTFFSLMPDPASGETVGIEHRLTWYASDGRFDTTPGQQRLHPILDAEHFGRVIAGEGMRQCIGCHTTSAEIVGTRVEHLYAGVHCERCHGSGVSHVAAAERGDDDAARGLIHRNWTTAEEIALCGECHRMPRDISPDRLARYPNSLIRFQPVGLLRSRCYLESDGALRCTTCHDPHAPPTERTAAEHVETCLECHRQPQQTQCPVSPRTDCISCHMPPVDLVRGIEFHDHWIRVRKGDPASTPEETAPGNHATLP